MVVSSGGLFDREFLDREQTLACLRESPMARVLISLRCLPAALPVYLSIFEHYVLIATAEAAVVNAARHGDVLAVQADGTRDDGTTWSVQVTGTAHVPLDTDPLAKRGGELLAPVLANGATLVAIAMTVVRGERVRWSFPN